MRVIETEIEGVVLLAPRVFGDERGYFFESFSSREFAIHFPGVSFVQDNESCSRYGVIRGLHYQTGSLAQAKLVRVVKGKVLDVAVDIRRDSPTFGRSVSCVLSEENKLQLYIPVGFAHGFAVQSGEAILQYKCSAFYSPEHEGGIRIDDPTLNIDWGIPEDKRILSEKDRHLPTLDQALTF